MTTIDLNQLLSEALGAFRAGNFSLVRDISSSIQRKAEGEPGSLRLLGQVEYLEGNVEAAIEAFEKSLKAKPGQYSLLIKLGNAFSDLGEFEKAKEAFSRALPHSQDPHLAYLSRAQISAVLGLKDESYKDLEAALKYNPLKGETYRLMTKLGHPQSKTKEFSENLLNKLATKVFQGEDAVQAHYALAGYFETEQDFDKMWFHLNQANGWQSNRSGDWKGAYKAIVEGSKKTFSKDFFKGAKEEKIKSVPILVVGLPRSGSTLLERMLAGHSKIAGAGETNLVTRIIGSIQNHTLLSYPTGLETLTPAQWSEFTDLYLNGLGNRGNQAPFVIDKLLSNSFFIGLIKKMIPQTKVIHIQRDPMDTAFSIYKNHFWETQSPEFCSLEGIGAYASLVKDIMGHWKGLFPGEIYDLSYEELVNDPKKVLKGTLTYLGLEMEQGVLDHRSTKTLSSTLSTAQVNEPISTQSIGMGRRFEKELTPFREALGKD